MAVKAVDFLHEPARPVPRECVTDFLRRHESDAQRPAGGLHREEEACPVAAAFPPGVDAPEIPIPPDPALPGKRIPQPFSGCHAIRH